MCSHLHFVTGHSGPIIKKKKKRIGVMQKRMQACSVMSDSETPWTASCQAPQSMGFSRQEYWSVLPFPPPETNYTIHQIGCNGINPVSRVILIKWWQNRWEKQIEKSESNLKRRREIPILELVWNPVLQLRFPEFLPRSQGSPQTLRLIIIFLLNICHLSPQ